MQNIFVPSLNFGNTNSVIRMIEKVANNVNIMQDWSELKKADKIFIVGVGSYDFAVKEYKPYYDRVREEILVKKKPILGICLGMQILFDKSEEGIEQGMSVMNGNVVRFKPEKFDENSKSIKIPHMGWDIVQPVRDSQLFKKDEYYRFYFAHSYHVVCDHYSDILAEVDYGYRFSVAVQHENIFGVQFHPEKSHKFGMNLISNFLLKI
jgi:glutamine amidotransferase